MYAPTIDRLSLLTNAAHRTRLINELFGTHLTPAEVARDFADEDIDLLLAWKEHT
jgi:hypothetical protein